MAQNVKKSHKKLYFILGVIIVVGLTLVGLHFFGLTSSLFSFMNKKEGISGSHEYVQVTKENLPTYLESLSAINDLPNDASVEVKFFHFEGDERIWEQSYTITQGKARVGETVSPDIVVVLQTKYIKDLGNFCSTMKSANKNGDLGFEMNQGKAALLWKYKDILKYKKCFGLWIFSFLGLHSTILILFLKFIPRILIIKYKLQKLLISKKSLSELIKTTQYDYFKKKTMSEIEYKVKLERFKQLEREFDRQILLLRTENFVLFKVRQNENQEKIIFLLDLSSNKDLYTFFIYLKLYYKKYYEKGRFCIYTYTRHFISSFYTGIDDYCSCRFSHDTTSSR